MKVGKVPENVLKRSVFKQLHTTRKEVLLGAGVGEDCAAMKLAEDEVFVISTDPITGAAKDIGALAVQITVNDLASAGAEPIGIMLTVLLPEYAEEKDLKTVMAQVEEACEKNHIQVMGGHTEVTKDCDFRDRCRKSKRRQSHLYRGCKTGDGYHCHKVDWH